MKNIFFWSILDITLETSHFTLLYSKYLWIFTIIFIVRSVGQNPGILLLFLYFRWVLRMSIVWRNGSLYRRIPNSWRLKSTKIFYPTFRKLYIPDSPIFSSLNALYFMIDKNELPCPPVLILSNKSEPYCLVLFETTAIKFQYCFTYVLLMYSFNKLMWTLSNFVKHFISIIRLAEEIVSSQSQAKELSNRKILRLGLS